MDEELKVEICLEPDNTYPDKPYFWGVYIDHDEGHLKYGWASSPEQALNEAIKCKEKVKSTYKIINEMI